MRLKQVVYKFHSSQEHIANRYDSKQKKLMVIIQGKNIQQSQRIPSLLKKRYHIVQRGHM